MNLNESTRDWITHRMVDFPRLAEIDILTGGEEGTESPPFIGIFETDSGIYEQGGVTMHGVTVFEITVELHTVPATEEEGGTAATDERILRDDLYNILGDRGAIEWMQELNGWRVFDIRLASPTTEPNEGRRISRFTMEITACPI